MKSVKLFRAKKDLYMADGDLAFKAGNVYRSTEGYENQVLNEFTTLDSLAGPDHILGREWSRHFEVFNGIELQASQVEFEIY